ncbi:TIGR03620 family F420-dependent LLM class oxidoreductase [Mycolicibacterium wolinskyi]|uniref:TIGR03620 family F420-dependent LLM class oxidoreductase n=1 Tax=Mycolicibacterium wolinskyi TaxID=59750 RepID=UPI0039177403
MNTMGPFGIAVDVGAEYLETAPEIEALGFGTLWVNGGQLDRLDRLRELIEATSRAVVAPAVVMPDGYRPGELGAFYRQVEDRTPGRLVMGLGPLAGAHASRRLAEYFGDPEFSIPPNRRLLAAFGPSRLALAREYCAGAVPMLFTPQGTAAARRRLGEDRILALGQYVVMDEDPETARDTARVPLRFLFSMPSYVNSALRQGFTEADVNSLSDRLVDSLVAWGTPGQIAERLREQRAAGADHVYATVLHGGEQPGVLDSARVLGPLLFGE